MTLIKCIHVQDVVQENGQEKTTCRKCGQELVRSLKINKAPMNVRKLGLVNGYIVEPPNRAELMLSIEEIKKLEQARKDGEVFEPVDKPVIPEPAPAESIHEKIETVRQQIDTVQQQIEEVEPELVHTEEIPGADPKEKAADIQVMEEDIKIRKKHGGQMMTWKEKKEKALYYDGHLTEIMADVDVLGRKETSEKWGIPYGSFPRLINRYKKISDVNYKGPTGEKPAKENMISITETWAPIPDPHPVVQLITEVGELVHLLEQAKESPTVLPAFPDWNEKWSDNVKEWWMKTYKAIKLHELEVLYAVKFKSNSNSEDN